MTKADNSQTMQKSLRDATNIRLPISWFFAFSAFVITIFFTTLPIIGEHQKEKIEQLSKEKEELEIQAEKTNRTFLEKFKNQEKKIKTLEEDFSTLKKKHDFLIAEKPFAPPLPYPKGLARIEISDSIDKVFETFKDYAIDRSNRGYVSIDLDTHPIFSSVTYYFTKNDPAIYQILYFLKHDINLSKDFLKETLSEIYGNPTFSEKQKNVWFINSPKPLNINADNQSLLISARDIYPKWLLLAIEDGSIKLPQSCTAPSKIKENILKNKKS